MCKMSDLLSQFKHADTARAINENIQFANRADLDKAAQNELPHLDLHCLLSFFLSLNMV